MNLKVLIADDDFGMRLILKKAIEKVEAFELIAEAEDGEEALELYEKLPPDIVFMDVEMPKLDGLECARRIADINPKTIIIFATAHEEYMSKAFEMYAFDYLVKPFKLERVYQTLQRIKEQNTQKEQHIISRATRYERGLEKLLVKSKEGLSFIDTGEIIIIQREGRNTVIHTSNESFSTSESLSEIEERLDKSQFFRSHKSYIVNLSMITKIFPYGRWTYVIKFKNTDKDALLTHEKYDELREIFKLA